jgi:hypothetical protein
LPVFYFVNLILWQKLKRKRPLKKEAKPRAEHYVHKVAINGNFSDVIGVAMGKKPKKKEDKNK